jgi:hypothetical protein
MFRRVGGSEQGHRAAGQRSNHGGDRRVTARFHAMSVRIEKRGAFQPGGERTGGFFVVFDNQQAHEPA